MNTQAKMTEKEIADLLEAAKKDPKYASGFNGFETSSVNYASLAGVVGGVIGGLMAYAEGSTVVGAGVGAAIGGGVGYCVGKVVNPINSTNLTLNVLGGSAAACFGIGMAGVAAGAVGSLEKLMATTKGE